MGALSAAARHVKIARARVCDIVGAAWGPPSYTCTRGLYKPQLMQTEAVA